MKRKNFPEVVTLCGSTRFKEQYLEVQKRLTLEGKIVISCGLFNHADDEQITDEQKKLLDELHFRKIDLSDSIYVIDVKGYVGTSTRNEIEYARAHNKEVRFYSGEDQRSVPQNSWADMTCMDGKK